MQFWLVVWLHERETWKGGSSYSSGGEERRVGEDSDESGRGDHPYRLPTTSVSFHAEIILESTK